MTRRALFLVMLLNVSLLCFNVGCSKTSEDDLDDASAGDGDGDGDTSGDGDGDGDTTGDGDGDGDTTGDGDGDGDATGDGDGDGDGDLTSDDDGGVLTGNGEPCGSKICDEAACCADPFQSLCGAPIGERGCIMPPPEDTVSFEGCPGVNAGGVFMIPSCCTPEGACGIDAQQFGAGCIELGEFAMIVEEMGGGGMITVPEPQACPD